MTNKFLYIVVLFFYLISGMAYAKNNDYDYSQYISESEKFIPEEFSLSDDDITTEKLINSFIDVFNNNFKNQLKNILTSMMTILCICFVTSILNTFVTSSSVGKTGVFAGYIISSMVLIANFKSVADTGIKTIRDICDYMNISFPGYMMLLASSGYNSTASIMNCVFIIIINILNSIVLKVITPIIYSCGILTLANGICENDQLNNIIKLLIKSLKYIVGFMLIIFSTVMTITGLTSPFNDGFVIKTTKYAVGNFVPLVGACLSDTVSTLMQTGTLIKNTVGIIGIITISFIVFIPILKIFTVSFAIRLLSHFSGMILYDKLSGMLETLSDIVSFIGSVLCFVTVSFILTLGIIISIGG